MRRPIVQLVFAPALAAALFTMSGCDDAAPPKPAAGGAGASGAPAEPGGGAPAGAPTGAPKAKMKTNTPAGPAVPLGK